MAPSNAGGPSGDEPFELARILSWDSAKGKVQLVWFYRLSDVASSAVKSNGKRKKGTMALEPRRLVASMNVDWTGCVVLAQIGNQR